MVLVFNVGVMKGEPVWSKELLFELYQATFPEAQVADNEAVVLLQIVGFIVPVGTEGLKLLSPVIVQPLPPLPISRTKLALSAAEAQYWRPTAPRLLPVTVPALKPVRVAS